MTANRAAAYRQRLFRTGANDTLPLTLRHQRIYILPTRLGLAMASVVLLMLVASVNYRLSLGYALSFILTGLFASCLLHAYRNLAGIEIQNITAADCYAPGPQIFTVEAACSGGRKRYSIEVRSADSHDQFDLDPNGSGRAQLQVSGLSRGKHLLGRLTVSSTFPLGLWRSWAYLHTPVGSFVYPQPEQPAAEFPATDGGANTSQAHGGKPVRAAQSGEFDSLRNWQRSDSPASIAWKAVARGNGWFSKDFCTAGQDEKLCFDWHQLPVSMTVEQRLSRLCAWIVRADAQAKPWQLVLPSNSATPQYGQKTQAMRRLATLELDSGTE